nr:ATP-binding cassette domain-containing protein [Candidatus Neomarinimicrobiota bacterium]
ESTENSDLFMHITLKNTSLIYPGTQHHAIDDISMTIKAGEAIGIIGASGSGKTTLINTILGLIEPQSGNILYNNLPLNNNIHKWHKHVAYLPQDSFITDDSVRHNVALGIENSKIDDSHVYQSLRKASLDDLIEQLPDDINTILGENGMRLSGGQRQRIVLARAFYHNRDVLIMDESTSALDNATEREVVSEIQKLKGSITLIVIAHRMSTIKHCDRIYLLENGKIIDQGNYKHIVRDKTLNNG